jgi:CheY-like chemotaxis protein
VSGSEEAARLARAARRLAHGINNQLAIVLGRADSLRAALQSDPTAERHLDEIAQAVQRASDLALQLLSGAWEAAVDVCDSESVPTGRPDSSTVGALRPAGETPRVLVVDDDSALRTLASRALARAGYSIREAATGEEALALFDSESAELVVTDLAMPGISGLALAEELAKRAPEIRVLFVTGYADTLGDSGVPSPQRALLAKPYTAQTLVQRVGELLAPA